MVLSECMEFLHWICQPGVLLSQLCLPFHFHTNVYPGENNAIIFRKSVHFVLWWEELMYFYSVEFGALIWSGWWIQRMHYRLRIHLGDTLAVLGFGRYQQNQFSFPVWIHQNRCGDDLGSCFGCWGISLGKWWGVFWFWIVWLVLV